MRSKSSSSAPLRRGFWTRCWRTEGIQVVEFNFYSDEGKKVIREHKAKDVPAIIIGDSVVNYRDYEGNVTRLKELINAALEGESIVHEPAEVEEKHLSMVACFSLGIFVVYYLIGVGLFHLLQEKSIASGFRLVLTALLLVLGMMQMEDARRLKSGRESLFRTDWAMAYFQGALASRSLSSYFLLGALFSLVKAPCVGAIYIAIIGIISSQGYTSSGIIYLMLYNLWIVLPVLLLGGILALGMSPDQVDRFRNEHRVAIRVVTGLTLIVLSPLIYWELI